MNDLQMIMNTFFEECSGSISDFSTNSITGPDSYNQFISVPGRKIPKIPLQGNSSAGQVTTKMQIQIQQWKTFQSLLQFLEFRISSME